MSHFAKVIDGIVETVQVADQNFIDSGVVGDPNNWIQTSYNTRGGVHYAPNSNEPDGGIALRKNYAGVGHTYDQTREAWAVTGFWIVTVSCSATGLGFVSSLTIS